jgi:hypothetical protein
MRATFFAFPRQPLLHHTFAVKQLTVRAFAYCNVAILRSSRKILSAIQGMVQPDRQSWQLDYHGFARTRQHGRSAAGSVAQTTLAAMHASGLVRAGLAHSALLLNVQPQVMSGEVTPPVTADEQQRVRQKTCEKI